MATPVAALDPLERFAEIVRQIESSTDERTSRREDGQ
jgi:hypothetical protein